MKKIFFIFLFFCSTDATVYGQTITFNGLSLNINNPAVVDGYKFTYMNMDGWGIGNTSVFVNEVSNGTDFIGARDTVDRDSTIRMVLDNGGAFSLSAFDGGDNFNNLGGRTIEVTGFLNGGGTVVDTFTTVASTLTGYNSSAGFSNLLAVEFHNFGPQGDGFVLDNIVVSAVPVPAAVWLFGSGLTCLFGIKKGKAMVSSI